MQRRLGREAPALYLENRCCAGKCHSDYPRKEILGGYGGDCAACELRQIRCDGVEVSCACRERFKNQNRLADTNAVHKA